MISTNRFSATLLELARRNLAAHAMFILMMHIMSLLATSAEAASGGRVALVIGNGGYTHVPSLKNPTRDAADFAAKLEDLGFDVILGIDADHAQFGKLLNKTLERAESASAVVFFYAGHGFEISGLNRIVPVDAELRDRSRIPDETIDMNDVVRKLSGTASQLVVLLDACRNNPLPKGVRLEDDGEGLAKIETGRDIFVAFATEPKQVARDGKGRNSAFTRALLTHLDRPGLSVSDMMVDVRRDVFASTKGKQLPWDQSSLKSAFYFHPEESGIGRKAEADRNSSDDSDASTSNQKSGKSVQLEALPSDGVLQPIETSDNGKPPESGAPAIESNASQEAKRQQSTKNDEKNVRRQIPAPKEKQEAEQLKRKQTEAKKNKKKETTAPVVTKKDKQVSRGKRPDARVYSYKIWRERSIPHGVSTVSTPYGTLRCRAHYSGWEDSEQRTCSWK